MDIQEIREGIARWFWGEDKKRNNLYLDGIGVIHYSDADQILSYLAEKGACFPVEGELPKELTNNIGCMSKVAIEDFANRVLGECGYPHRMEWTTAGDIVIGETIYIDESHINEYPYLAKERVLHEIAHIDTWPQDDRHGEIFHIKLAELIGKFLGGSCRVITLKEMMGGDK